MQRFGAVTNLTKLRSQSDETRTVNVVHRGMYAVSGSGRCGRDPILTNRDQRRTEHRIQTEIREQAARRGEVGREEDRGAFALRQPKRSGPCHNCHG